MKKKTIIIILIIIILLCVIGGVIWFISSNNKTENVANTDVVPTEAPAPELTEAPTPEPTEAPTPEPTEAPTPKPTSVPTPEPTEAPTPTPRPEITLKLELKDTGHPRIMEILDYVEYNFSYQIPQFRSDSDDAKRINQKIVDDILPYIEREAEYDDSIWYYGGIRYEITEYEEIVSILITIPYDNDGKEYYVYNYDFGTDTELTNAEILAIKGMTEKDFIEAANELQRERLDAFLVYVPEEYHDGYRWLLKEANESVSIDSPMYLGEDGTLYAIIYYAHNIDGELMNDMVFEIQ